MKTIAYGLIAGLALPVLAMADSEAFVDRSQLETAGVTPVYALEIAGHRFLSGYDRTAEVTPIYGLEIEGHRFLSGYDKTEDVTPVYALEIAGHRFLSGYDRAADGLSQADKG